MCRPLDPPEVHVDTILGVCTLGVTVLALKLVRHRSTLNFLAQSGEPISTAHLTVVQKLFIVCCWSRSAMTAGLFGM